MIETTGEARELIFGLDIGTRNVVGTVGYNDEDEKFHVIAQSVREHDTRAMLDGQIHDINKVGKIVKLVKEDLEEKIKAPLKQVCIAAAGRVLKTVTTHVDNYYGEETVVTAEDIYALDILGVEKAQEIVKAENDTKFKFYCVGYTIVKYYLNDDLISHLEGHKADKISEDIIVTFLPEDVVDGLYAAVAFADLEVVNLTLEPIAAINVAIPESFRMLNIALVDVGAGTSDISVTRDGSIIAYGMIPIAGDEITELLVQHYLVDFKTAEYIKIQASKSDIIQFNDIMCISHEIIAEEVWDVCKDTMENMAKEVAAKIKELNGDKAVSACFVVGGGGRVNGFTEVIADELGIVRERVALRGEEVLGEVIFDDEDVVKDSLIVTPIGICRNYYDQKNTFVFVYFNGERIKLYNNNKLTVIDAALEAGYKNEDLFPKRGAEIEFTVNGKTRVVRGQLGESAVVTIDGREVSLNTAIANNNRIEIKESTAGADAKLTIGELPEYNSTITFNVNGQDVTCPRFAEVNGVLESPYSEILPYDEITMLNYYTVQQVIDFMDVNVDLEGVIYVNNKSVDVDEHVYENFTVEFRIGMTSEEAAKMEAREEAKAESLGIKKPGKGYNEIIVVANGEEILLEGKSEYVFVDIFDHINFDLTQARGRNVISRINDVNCSYNDTIRDGDKVDVFWEEWR